MAGQKYYRVKRAMSVYDNEYCELHNTQKKAFDCEH